MLPLESRVGIPGEAACKKFVRLRTITIIIFCSIGWTTFPAATVRHAAMVNFDSIAFLPIHCQKVQTGSGRSLHQNVYC